MKLFAFSFLFALLASVSWAQISFQAPIHLDKNWGGGTPCSADFDNDGKLDLLHYSNKEVIVFYNNGSHDFTTLTIQISPNDLPFWELTLDVGDLNADGKADVVVYQNRDLPLLAFLSTGRAFTKKEIDTHDLLDFLTEIRIADIDNDGHADIVAPGAISSLYVFKGDGSGEFVLTQDDTFQSIFSFFISDLNDDGLNDVVGVHEGSEIVVSVASAIGTFTHQALASVGESIGYGTIAIADFNGDGFQDLAATSGDVQTSVLTTRIYANDSNGNFAASVALSEPIADLMTAIDYDGDGHRDLVGLAAHDGLLTTFQNNGDGTFAWVEAFDKPQLQYPGRMSVADFDQDGDEELILSTGGQQVRVQAFQAGKFISIEDAVFGINPRKVLSADMNKDGYEDLVLGNAFLNTIEILYGNETHTYTTKKSFRVPSEFRDLAIADFNSDGYADIAYTCNETHSPSQAGLFLSTPAGDYAQTTVVDDLMYLTAQALDFDGDGNADLILGNDLYTNDGTGHFNSRTLISQGNHISAAQDIDNDGFPDVIVNTDVMLNYGTEPKIAFNDGHGAFVEFSALAEFEFQVVYLSIGYINDDQLPDILLAGYAGNSWERSPVRVLINKGNRQFEASDHQLYSGNNSTIADFNLDGRNDILSINEAKAYVHLQDQNGEFTSTFEVLDDNFYFDYSAADDLDSDGKPDFYSYNQRGGLYVTFNDILPGPTIQPSALAIQSLSDDEVTATFLKGNGTGRLLLLRKNIGSDDVPADNVSYDFSSSFSAGTTIGDGNHVVLTGDVTTVFVSDLDEGTEYELVAFEYAENHDKSKIDYNVAFPPSITFTTKRKQTITFGAMSIATFGPNPILIPVSASSGLPVTLTVSSGQATINGNQVTAAQPGPLMLKASQPGNSEYMPAPNKETTFCVFPPVPTISVNKDDPANPILASSATTNNQWQEDGTDIPGAINQTLEPEGDGLYSVKVSYAGCARTSLPTALVITEVNKEESFRMFPNPAVNQLMITLPGTEGITSLTMMDMRGRPVTPAIVIRGNTAEINLDQLTEGIYLVQAANGGGVFQGKVLKVK